MTVLKPMDREYNFTDFIKQLYKWRKELLWAFLLIMIVSIVASLFLPNYYKAQTTFYAASPDLAKPVPIGGDEKDMRIYGDDNDLDRLFTIANSHEVLFFLVDSFKLYDHYKIDIDDAKAKFKVIENLLENYKTIKTKYGALELVVEDKSPEMAAAMANAAREKIEEKAQMVVKKSQKFLIENYEKNINIKQKLVDSVSMRLRNIKTTTGVYDTWNQVDLYNKIFANAESELQDAKGKIAFYKGYPSMRDSLIVYMAKEKGATNKKANAQAELEKFAPIATELRQLEQEQSRIIEQINFDKERLKQLDAAYSAPFTAIHLIESAIVPVEKSRPKRSIIVLLSTLAGVVFSLLGVLIIDNIKSAGIIR